MALAQAGLVVGPGIFEPLLAQAARNHRIFEVALGNDKWER